jgi:hypothetical protein
VKTPWNTNIHLILKNEWQEETINLFWGWFQWEDSSSGHKERGNEGIYGGCVLNAYMKINE